MKINFQLNAKNLSSSFFSGRYSPMCFRKHFSSILLILFIFINMPGHLFSAETRHRTVRIGYVDSPRFSEGKTKTDIKYGYAYEFFQKIDYYAGWDYEYIYGDWKTMLTLLSEGKVDLLAGISYTEERSKKFAFPDYSMGSESYYIYVPKNSILTGMGVKGLAGKTIGCTEGSMQNIFLERWKTENDFSCIVKTFSSNEDLYDAFKSGRIDAIVDTDISTLPTDGMIPLNKIGSSDFYIAVSKSNPELLAELNIILEKINRNEPDFIQNLHAKYFSHTAVATKISSDEENWLKEHSEIRVGYMENYMPFCSTDKNGNAEGLINDLFSVLFDRLDISNKPEIIFAGYKNQDDLLNSITEGNIDVIFPVNGNIWYSESRGIYQSYDLMDVPIDLIYRGDYFDLKINKIGVNLNNLVQHQFSVTQFPDAEIIYYKTIEDCLNAVLNGEIDCTLMNGLRTDSFIFKDYYKALNSYKIPDQFHLTLGIRKGETSLLSLINRAISTLDKNYALSCAYKYQKKLVSYTAKDFLWNNILWFILALAVIIANGLFFLIRDNKRSKIFLQHERELSKGLENALKAEQNANKAKTDFLNAVSHDIRTPMNAIIGFSDLMQNELENPEKMKDYLKKIQVSGKSLLNIINNVLDLSQLESGKVTLNETKIDFYSAQMQISPLFEKITSEKNQKISYSSDIIHPKFYCDIAKIRNITMNLISNAVKYTPEGGSIEVHIKEFPGTKEGHAIFVNTVKDNGIGMSKEFQKKLFETFEREHTTTESKVSGLGLGMSIVKKYVDMMGGKIEVESELGKGTKISVIIELRLADDDNDGKSKLETVNLKGKEFFLPKTMILMLKLP